MKTLALQGGDLVVGSQGHATISGNKKIRQDLALALGERYGNDRFHLTWGSTLPNYVGRPVTADSDLIVRSEVARVVQSYIDGQQAQIATDALSGTRSKYTTSDVVAQLNNIVTSIDLDTIHVKISLSTQAQESLTLTRTVTT